MAALVATMVVGPLLSTVKDKASSYLLDQYKVMKGMEEQHEILKRKLPAILDIITDAEQAATHREGVAAWLEAIKKVAYQANEAFDEFKYEALRRQAKKKGHYKELGFHVVKLFPTHNRFVFRKRMGKKLHKIAHAIEVLVTEMNAFGFKYQQQPPVTSQLRRTGPAMTDPKEIMEIIRKSRDNDKSIIVSRLVGQANNADLGVVPIVGMGGLGKTTLAQLVYKESKILEHFGLLLWVCVSECFDVDSLAKSIVEAAPGKKDVGTEATAMSNTPLGSLQNVVSGQRYLLVLDDIWERQVHIWEGLKSCLQHGGKGSVVLATTRDAGVAKTLCAGEAYNLTALEDKFIKEIIETRAFSHLQKEEERPAVLVNMVDEIVKRCVGSPLAATALGAVLHTKTSEEEWKVVSSRSKICTMETGILPILKLSYNDLPSHMKQCFAFCAIFPKDYMINVEKLIQLWIAHGFIQETEVHLEIVGKRIFNELASRSFFQDVRQVESIFKGHDFFKASYSRTTCKIHDLMHDVALSVMEKECAIATDELDKTWPFVTEEPSQGEWLRISARHLFLSCKEPERKLNSSLEKSSLVIQTLMCDNLMRRQLKHLSKYLSLRALELRSLRSSFPLRPKHLHHLRYLDLSESNIMELPQDMSILYNLQTLNLSGCFYLRGLPRQMKYMTALRHLYTHGCSMLKSMPRDLRKLTSLQTLTCFVAGSGSNCSNVRELGNLNLGGQLELHHLANVTEKDARAVNLVMKKELRVLTLRWTVGRDDVVEETSSEEDAGVLEKLKPCDGLHAIRIHSYRATTFPIWMATLQNIVEIHLFGCRRLQWLFRHDRDTSYTFPKLKQLTLQDLVRLERWWEVDNDGLQGEETMFPSLEMLLISDCEKLAALPGHSFPNLQEAGIFGCPQLTTTTKSPNLRVLHMKNREAGMFSWVARHMTSLAMLQLQSHEEDTETTLAAAELGLREVVNNKKNGNDQDFPLIFLVLRNFKSGVTELCACFVNLQDLSIFSSDALIYWPEKEFEGLVSLRKLIINECDNLIGYAQASAEPSTSSEMRLVLPRLESLEIMHCHNLVEVFKVPASLRTMSIWKCSKLESISGRRLQQGQSASLIHQGSSIPEVSSLSHGAGAEHFEILRLTCCDGLTGVLHLPPSIKEAYIAKCNGLTSLEFCSLEDLHLAECDTFASLPDRLQAYSSLQRLWVTGCPCLKTLPTSLQQRLGSLQHERIDHHYRGNKPMLLNPKTWKYVWC